MRSFLFFLLQEEFNISKEEFNTEQISKVDFYGWHLTMSAFSLQPGDDVRYNQNAYRIKSAVSLTTVRIEDCRTGQDHCRSCDGSGASRLGSDPFSYGPRPV